ncbi:MAG: radical SAM protein [Planctomycetota bacterium]
MPTGRKLLAKVYAALPRPIQMRIARAYASRKQRRLAGLETPTAVILYVTQRCNARCAHCFYWKELGAQAPEFPLDDLRTLARSFQHPVSLSVTGGEPTLRKDLFEIAETFHTLNGCREIKFATNGMLPDRIVDTCERILAELDLESVGVQVSLDGLEETHNAIRRVPAFEPAMESVRRLKELADTDRRFSVRVACCIQKKNIDELRDFVESLLPLRVPLQFGLIRGESFGTWNLPEGSSSGIDPRDPESPLVPVDRLEQFFDWLRARNDESEFTFWSPMQQEKIELSLRMLREQKKCIACYAGVIDAVIYANGDVALCELTHPVGNLYDYDLDIARLWHSAEADEMRRKIRACFCIHGCNLVTGLLFRPEHIRDAVIQKAKS